LGAWEKVLLARNLDRPTAIDYINNIFEEFIEIHGDRYFGDDKAIITGIGLLDGIPVTIIGEEKGKGTKEKLFRNFGMPNPEGYRKALRAMKQAEKFNRPIITFVDTPGAYPGIGAEERGQGEAIAKNLMEMSSLKVPIICIVIGEGSSGGGLAVAVGNKVIMLENSVYSVLSPEGFATILWKDVSKAQEASEIMKITAKDLEELGIIDEIIVEPNGGAQENINEIMINVKDVIIKNLKELSKLTKEELVEERYNKFRVMGKYKIV